MRGWRIQEGEKSSNNDRGIKVRKGAGGKIQRQRDLKELKRDRETDEKETKKFRIHNVTVKFSGEICRSP